MAIVDRVIAIASQQSGISLKKISGRSAVDQDLQLSGDDVTEFAEALVLEFGDQVWAWPWQRFAQLDEGISILFPFMAIWQLLRWPITGRFSNPSPFERLELGHIAEVIEKGEWFDP